MEADIASPEEGSSSDWRSNPSTCPNFVVSFRGYEKEAAERLGAEIGNALRSLGRIIDIAGLDGVTVAYDYDDALAQLDRGYETSFVLERTNDVATGIAMTPSVLRNDVLKSHIVLSGDIADGLLDDDEDLQRKMVHTLAHESAHVETTAAWDRCFPGELLRTSYRSNLDAWRSQVMSACWEEYSACRISGDIGYDPVPGYVQTFLKVLSEIDGKVRELVAGFEGGNANTLVGPVFGAFGNLMKFACYLQGSLVGTGRSRDDVPEVTIALASSWFDRYFDRLAVACAEIFDEFGRWTEKSKFDVISDMVEEIVEDEGRPHLGSRRRKLLNLHPSRDGTGLKIPDARVRHYASKRDTPRTKNNPSP